MIIEEIINPLQLKDKRFYTVWTEPEISIKSEHEWFCANRVDSYRENFVIYRGCVNRPFKVREGQYVGLTSKSKHHGTWRLKNDATMQDVLMQKKFDALSSKWKEQVAGYSTTNRITNNANYKYIMSMGEKILPFILKDLIEEPHYWFEALKYITETDPVPDKHYGDIYKMSEDWIKWGRENNYIK